MAFLALIMSQKSIYIELKLVKSQKIKFFFFFFFSPDGPPFASSGPYYVLQKNDAGESVTLTRAHFKVTRLEPVRL